MNTHRAPVPCVLELLDARLLLTAPETFPLLNLIGFDRRGASSAYYSKYAISGSEIESTSGRGTYRIDVRPNLKAVRGKSCVMVDATSQGVTATTAWYTDKRGTYLASTFLSTDWGDLRLNLANPRVAPKFVSVGDTLKQTSDVSGTIQTAADYLGLSGTFTGTVTTTTRLIGRETVTVPAGTFNAVHGRLDAVYDGRVKTKGEGQRVTVDVSLSMPTEFWAVPGKGIVLSSAKVDAEAEAKAVSGLVEVEDFSATTVTTNKLISFSPLGAKTRAAAFSVVPIAGGGVKELLETEPAIS